MMQHPLPEYRKHCQAAHYLKNRAVHFLLIIGMAEITYPAIAFPIIITAIIVKCFIIPAMIVVDALILFCNHPAAALRAFDQP